MLLRNGILPQLLHEYQDAAARHYSKFVRAAGCNWGVAARLWRNDTLNIDYNSLFTKNRDFDFYEHLPNASWIIHREAKTTRGPEFDAGGKSSPRPTLESFQILSKYSPLG